MFRFIHIADVHMGARPDPGKVWSDSRMTELEKSFDSVINICNMRQIDLLLIAGDLYDAPPTLRELRLLDAKLSRLHHTETVICAGSSDYIGPDAPARNYEFNSNTVLLPPGKPGRVFIEDINVCVTGMSYEKPEYTERLLERMEPGRVDAYNILLGSGGDKLHMPFSRNALLEKGYNYIALGRRHQPTYVVKNRMAFAGSLEPLSERETGKHGFIFGEVNDQGENHIVFVSASMRSYINKTYELTPDNTAAEIRALVERDILETGSQNIYKLLLKGKINGNVEINLSELVRRFRILDVEDQTSFSYDVEELTKENNENLIRELLDRLSDEDSPLEEKTRERAKEYGMAALLASGD